jgi:hypothetical protein
MASILFSLCPVSYLDTRGFGLEMRKNDERNVYDILRSLNIEKTILLKRNGLILSTN